MNYFSIYFGKEVYMFRTDLLSIIKSLGTVFTATGISYTEIFKMSKITVVRIYVYCC